LSTTLGMLVSPFLTLWTVSSKRASSGRKAGKPSSSLRRSRMLGRVTDSGFSSRKASIRSQVGESTLFRHCGNTASSGSLWVGCAREILHRSWEEKEAITISPPPQNQTTWSWWTKGSLDGAKKRLSPSQVFLFSFLVPTALVPNFSYFCRCYLHLYPRFKKRCPAPCVPCWCHLHQSRHFSWFSRFSCFAQLAGAFHNQEGRRWRSPVGQRDPGYRGSS